MSIKKAIKKLPIIKDVIIQRDFLLSEMVRLREDMARLEELLSTQGAEIQKKTFTEPQAFPPGHFYSPIPSVKEIKENQDKIFSKFPRHLPGIDLNEEKQLDILHKLASFYSEIPWSKENTSNLRFYFENSAFSYGDAITLCGMLRFISPKRLIEVGSGFSSCATLDVNELFFSDQIDCTFIEPYPDLLLSLIKEQDKARVTILPQRLQDTDIALFQILEENDILFIDSSHVSKINSDVNYLFFEILPRLRKGVYIHIHDIFYPFEYPMKWIYEGRYWNEDYMLRNFLAFNSSFEIVQFIAFLTKFHRPLIENLMPLFLKNSGGGIWLKKVK